MAANGAAAGFAGTMQAAVCPRAGAANRACRTVAERPPAGLEEDRTMPVTGLDHVNIVASDLAASVRFYAEVLGLERREGPSIRGRGVLQWMHDPQGRPIVHLAAAGGEGPAAGAPTGALDHVALACRDYDATIARLEEHGLAYRTSAIAELRLRQVFLADPSGVKLELTFRE
jgi:catechol 2,3-dioxygenase-like lactoylglutathione lyase family enzyme